MLLFDLKKKTNNTAIFKLLVCQTKKVQKPPLKNIIIEIEPNEISNFCKRVNNQENLTVMNEYERTLSLIVRNQDYVSSCDSDVSRNTNHFHTLKYFQRSIQLHRSQMSFDI